MSTRELNILRLLGLRVMLCWCCVPLGIDPCTCVARLSAYIPFRVGVCGSVNCGSMCGL